MDDEEIAAVTKVLRSGRLASGSSVLEFESRFAAYLGCEHAVAVNSGTAALHLALLCLKIGPGDEVIVPPLTFFSTVAAILYVGAIPVFADIEPSSLCLDPKDVKRCITSQTRAILPVHIYGNAAEMDSLKELAKVNGLALVEDAAQAHGTEYKGKKVGTFSDAGVFSFYATKHMTTAEGGILVTNSGRIAKLAKSLRNHGMKDYDTHQWLGYNYRMNEISAAIGLVQLKKLDVLSEKRIKNSKYLSACFAEMNLSGITVFEGNEDVRHTYYWFPIYIDKNRIGVEAKEFAKRMRCKGIETRSRYNEPLYAQPLLQAGSVPYPGGQFFSRLPDFGTLHLPVAERIMGQMLGLPNHSGLGKNELDRVVQAVTQVVGEVIPDFRT